MFFIDQIDQQESEITVHVSYIPYSKFKEIQTSLEEKAKIRTKYQELEALLPTLKDFNNEETTRISEEILGTYIELLSNQDYLPNHNTNEQSVDQDYTKLDDLVFIVEDELWGIFTNIEFDRNALLEHDLDRLRDSIIINLRIGRKAMNGELSTVEDYEITSECLLQQDDDSSINEIKNSIFETIYQKLATFGLKDIESEAEWPKNEIPINSGITK